MLRASLSPHHVVNTRHAADGDVVHDMDEGLLSFSGTEAHIKSIARVEAFGRIIAIRPGIGIASHHGRHADPAAIYAADGVWWLQLFFDGQPMESCTGSVRLTTDSGEVAELGPPAPRPRRSSRMISNLVRDAAGLHIDVVSPEPFERIVQQTCDGSYQEARHAFPAGSHRFRVEPGFCDSYGIAFSSRSIEGGEERKHMILGTFGAASGRHLLIAGEMLAPKTPHAFAYRSLIARYEGDLDAVLQVAEDFDELEIWHRPHEAAEVAAVSARPRTRLRSYGLAAEDADVTLWRPGDAIPDRPFSAMLFQDLSTPTAADILVDLALHAPLIHAGAPCLDRIWLDATRCVTDYEARSYGVGWSFALGDLKRGSIEHRKRTSLPSSPCVSCEHRASCEGLWPHPAPKLPIASPCRLAAALGSQVSELDASTICA